MLGGSAFTDTVVDSEECEASCRESGSLCILDYIASYEGGFTDGGCVSVDPAEDAFFLYNDYNDTPCGRSVLNCKRIIPNDEAQTTLDDDPCREQRACDTCVRNDGCGFCADDDTCRTGATDGPAAGVCTEWSYGLSECL